jgi:hypothetical protein
MASSLVADRLVLCVVFDRRSTLGLVRHRMRRSTERLTPVFESLFEKLGVAAGPVAPRQGPAVRVVERASRPVERKPVTPEAPAEPKPAPEPLLPVHFGVEAAAALDDLLGGDLS